MIIYIVVFSITTILGLIIDRYRKRPIQRSSDKRAIRILYVIVFFILSFFVGFRDVSVGSDSLQYYSKFQMAEDLSLFEYLVINRFLDAGFYAFTWIIQRVTGSIYAYFFIISCIYFSIYLRFISKYSSSAGWSIWLLNALGFTTFVMSTLRQALAMSFCLLAYIYMMEGKKKAWMSLFLAFSFHITSVVFLPMMFVQKLSNHKKPWGLFIIAAAVMLAAPIIMKYVMLLDIKDGRYSEASAVGGVGMIVFLVLQLFVGAFTYYPRRKSVPNNYYYEFYATGFALCAFLITRFNTAAMRLFWFFFSFAILFVPNVINTVKKSNKVIWSILFWAVTFYYLFFKVMADPYAESRLLLPYKFFWG